jgi:hypothetical protein
MPRPNNLRGWVLEVGDPRRHEVEQVAVEFELGVEDANGRDGAGNPRKTVREDTAAASPR